MQQPFLHDLTISLHAPVQSWAAADGGVDGTSPGTVVQGLFCGDERVVSQVLLQVPGHRLDHLHTHAPDGSVTYAHAVRADDAVTDPTLSLTRVRTADAFGVTETVHVASVPGHPVDLPIVLRIRPDATPMELIRIGRNATDADLAVVRASLRTTDKGARWSWRDTSTTATLTTDADVSLDDGGIVLRWHLRGERTAAGSWRVELRDGDAPFVATTAEPLVHTPSGRPELDRLLTLAFSDLNGLRMAEPERPTDAFLAAGAPWYLTLFGRDSLIAARLLLPDHWQVAASTLRVLAGRQGTRTDVDSAEQPGKILHEVRRVALALAESRQDDAGGTQQVVLPPEYYGTIDATPLWILLLADAHRAGMPRAEVEDLLPHLRRALVWLRDHGDADGDGFLEYHDTSGHGLANQGWKDSGDAIRWADGRQATSPIALCEVQGYAHGAALAGAELLEAFGDAGAAADWRAWADAMATRFRAAFWVSDDHGPYPALALDADKRPVDAVASNMGHLLGTGILNHDEAATVVARLMRPEMASGYGIRTLSTDNGGYWPLSYHGGSVWTHDTAVIIDGMGREGFVDEARILAEGLLHAAGGFDNRMPELFGGQSADEVYPPFPYPASCRPQAWAAASAAVVARALAVPAQECSRVGSYGHGPRHWSPSR